MCDGANVEMGQEKGCWEMMWVIQWNLGLSNWGGFRVCGRRNLERLKKRNEKSSCGKRMGLGSSSL